MNGNLKKNIIDFEGATLTISPDTVFGSRVILSKFVVVEHGCCFGDDVFVGNFTMFRPETIVGDRTKIGHSVVFEGQTIIGSDCVIQSQCHITLGAEIADCVFFGPGVIGVNDRRMCHMRPHMKWTPEPFSVGYGSRIGSGAIILPKVHIGENCVVAAGSVVTRNVPDKSIVVGSPARIVGEVPEDEWLL